MKVTEAMRKAVRREMQSLGGKTRAKNQTPDQRRAQASKAGKASNDLRWKTTAETRERRDARIFWDWPSGYSREELATRSGTSLGIVAQAVQAAKKNHTPEEWAAILERRKKEQKVRKVKP